MKEIKASDFRIGNWVSDYETYYVKEYYQVEQITKGEDGRLWVHYDDNRTRTTMPEPIPLTEEWLERFGFSDKYYRDGFIGKDFNSGEVTIDFVLSKPLSKGKWNTTYTYNLEEHRFTKIEFVHELQNLYHALTGEELTINN